MNDKFSICPICGRKLVEYKHNINKTLVSGLSRLNALGGRARLDMMGLDNTTFNNFQKLRYFGLAVPSGENSEWQITERGIWFLQGRVQIPRFVITKIAKTIRESNELVYITEIKDCVQYKVQWQKQASQPSLFE